MEHLTIKELTDYVRGLTDQEERVEMEEHLSRCPICQKSAAFYKAVNESAFTPAWPIPAEVVASAKAILAQERKLKPARARRFAGVLAQLIFPESGEWAVAGVRSAMQSGAARQAVYQWGNYFLDLRSESQPDTDERLLVGQVSNHLDAEEDMGTVQVRIVRGTQIAGDCLCNALGEFALAYLPSPRVHLEVNLPKSEICIKVPLKDVYPEDASQ